MVELPDGNILVSGSDIDTIEQSCEIYDFRTGNWRYTTPMNAKRYSHNMVLLNTGKVLVLGGARELSCELFDPVTESWTLTDSIPTNRLFGETVTKLQDGRVLVCGGFYFSSSPIISRIYDNCEIYDPLIERWESVTSMTQKRMNHRATLLDDGRVLVSGGENSSGFLAESEIYDPLIERWKIVSPMNAVRSGHASILLKNGKVLVSGGGELSESATCEIYDPSMETWHFTTELIYSRQRYNSFYIDNYNIMMLGGIALSSNYHDTWEIFDTRIMQPTHIENFLLKEGGILDNSIQLQDGKILIIGGNESTIRSGQLIIWPISRCFLFDISTHLLQTIEQNPDFHLEANFPNPFNPSTTIRYEIPNNSVSPTHVKLCIYDILGNEIETLVNQNQSPGKYSVEFDASKHGLSSGVYMYKLTAGDFTQSRKMVLTK